MIYDISADLLSAPVYEDDPAPELEHLKSMKTGDPYNLTRLIISSHAGTHIDSPLHFLERGADISRLPLELFIGDCRVAAVYEPLLTGADIDALPLDGVERLIIKGFGKAALTRSAAFAIAGTDIKLVGIDAQTIGAAGEEAEVHRELLGAGICVLEGVNLSGVQSGDYFLFCPPVKVVGAEGAPCRAILLKD
ncbi:MAG: cyclase family protein [Oscillospiraceae bacterium]|jgi:arylformamidase|nr:cyclase family protein [Oscillospiraceae bacterium]